MRVGEIARRAAAGINKRTYITELGGHMNFLRRTGYSGIVGQSSGPRPAEAEAIEPARAPRQWGRRLLVALSQSEPFVYERPPAPAAQPLAEAGVAAASLVLPERPDGQPA